MPFVQRPLFLVPSLMRQLPDTGAVMVDVSALETTDGTATAVWKAANALLDQLEPLIVEANLAGYEIPTIVAGTGGGAPCLVISVETFLADGVTSTWDEVVTEVEVEWASTTGALALQLTPRLAMREGVDGGSSIASHYAIAFTAPAQWLGRVDPSVGGWLVATTSSDVDLPEDVTEIAGRPGNPGTAATALTLAIRNAAAAQWNAHGRKSGELLHCALAPLFDARPDDGARRATWRRPDGDIGVGEAAAEIEDGVWAGASGLVPSYEELSSLTLGELLERSHGHAGSVRALDRIRAALRQELVRRHLVDPATIGGSGLREGELGPRFDEFFAAVETLGAGLFAVELFRMLELGLMSLDRRDPAEEMLPALVQREWTEPNITGFYDSVGSVTAIPIEDLVEADDAFSWFSTVAAESAVVSVNQAGDHLEAYWHERRFDPGVERPTAVVTWFGGGERDHGASGLAYRVVWVSSRVNEAAVEGSLTFTESGGTCDAVAVWGAVGDEATTQTLRRRSTPREIYPPGEDLPQVPVSALVRPFLSESEIDALPPEVRDAMRTAERYSLHPSEVVLVGAVVGRIVADLEAIAASWADSTTERAAMCENLATAFGYFARDGHQSELAAPAREYVITGLQRMDGDDSPLDPWVGYSPPTYLHALARSHAELRCDSITACLGLEQQSLEWFGKDHRYRYSFRTAPSVEGVTVRELSKQALKELAKKGPLVLSKIARLRPVTFGPDPKFDIIEAEFQKIEPYPDPDWPGTKAAPGSVFYDGGILGMGIAGSIGLRGAPTTEFSEINTMGDPWTPDDFEGPFWMVAQYWGASVFGIERRPEDFINETVRPVLGFEGDVRASGEYNYTQFVTNGKPDAWSVSKVYIDTGGLYLAGGGGASGGQLSRRDQPPPPASDDPSTGMPRTDSAVSFDVGRSELNDVGKALLHDVAAERLHQFASPATSIEVFGHASFGDARPLYNLILSQRRAANVVRSLRAYLGPLYAVRPERTFVLGLGDQQAEQDGGAAEQWRRVDVFIDGEYAVQLATGAP